MMLLRVALVLAYIVVANLALQRDSDAWAAVALGLLGPIVLVRGLVAGRLRAWGGIAVVAMLAWALSTTRAAVPLVMLVPSVFLTMAFWMFARTLLPGRIPLISQMAALIEGGRVEELPQAVRRHTAGVTWAWALLLGGMALLNLVLVVNTSPGGLLVRMGETPPWPMSPRIAASMETWGIYVPMVLLGVGEFVLRQWRFPGRYRNALDFVNRARSVPGEQWATLFRRS